MNGWIYFWGALLLVTLVMYAVLVAYVTVGGFNDIKQMFKKLSEEESGGGEE